MFDTHAHLNFNDFDEDREELIKECNKKNLSVINVGATLKSSKSAVEMAEKNKNNYATIGIHPLHAEERGDFRELEELAGNELVVAIGETGLDNKKKKTAKIQHDLFLKHIELAKKKDLPLILHSRRAHEETLEIIPNHKGVIHCFTGNLSQAKKYIKKGYLIGLNGIIFKMNLKKIIKEIPLDKILLETDCPYLCPPEWKGKNTPLGVFEVAKEVAKIKEADLREVEKVTDENTRKLFIS